MRNSLPLRTLGWLGRVSACGAGRARILGGFAAALLSGCSMAGSGLVDGDLAQTCHSDTGTYYLSKTFLQVKVVEQEIDNVPQYFLSDGIKVLSLPDKAAPFCIDYLASATSDDTLIVQRADGLLKKITTNAHDRSQEISKTLIKALFVGLSQNPNFDPNLGAAGRSLTTKLKGGSEFEALYDPFDEAQARNINHVLRKYGFCLVLADRVPRGDIESYCSNPLGHRSREEALLAANANDLTPVVAGRDHLRLAPEWTSDDGRGDTVCRYQPGDGPHSADCRYAAEPQGPSAYSQGIFYRARLPYSYYVYVRPNLKVMGDWQLRGVETIEFENESPIFGVAVDRTYFADRKTTLSFNRGVLQDVHITKDSELAGFVEVPLVIAQSIAALPTNIIQVRIDENNNREKLIRAQTQLIALKEKQKEAKQALDNAKSAGQQRRGDGGGERSLNTSSAIADFTTVVSTGDGQPIALTGVGGLQQSRYVERQQCMAGCSAAEVICQKYCTCTLDCADTGNTALACSDLCKRTVPQ